jgi:alanine-glyoxylate transaminase/serine-glyoxylate transaminase/serine-pyruvate transaminase
MNRSNEDHRSPAFPKLSKSVIDDVKQIFRTTTATSFIFPTTGTGAWESALTNTLSPGDKIISFRLGQFSLLWIDQMQRYNFDVDVVDCEWGTGVDLDNLKQKLQSDWSHSVKAVCVVHNETSTGVTNDIGAIRRVMDEARHPALLLVDGVSSIGAIDFRMDDWKVDVALTGSQKALSLPTGLGIVCASPKALAAAKQSKSTRVFFDWGDYLKFYEAGTYWPYTPSSQMLYGLRASLDMILNEEGLDNVIARHCRLGEATRQAVKAWGLTLCTQDPKWKSDTVTAVVVPSWINSNDIVKIAYKKYNLSLGIGLNKVAGKVFRIGHLGNVNELQMLGALAGVELCLMEVGYPVTLGSGVAAAQAHLAKKTPLISSRI